MVGSGIQMSAGSTLTADGSIQMIGGGTLMSVGDT
jgi:hypothetical protein